MQGDLMLKKSEVVDWLVSRGYSLSPMSKRGATKKLHYYNTEKPNRRYVLGPTSVRLESKTEGGTWIRLRSNYYKHLSFSEDMKLVGLLV